MCSRRSTSYKNFNFLHISKMLLITNKQKKKTLNHQMENKNNNNEREQKKITFPLQQVSFFLSSYVVPLTLICLLYMGMLARLWKGAPGCKPSAESRYIIHIFLLFFLLFLFYFHILLHNGVHKFTRFFISIYIKYFPTLSHDMYLKRQRPFFFLSYFNTLMV